MFAFVLVLDECGPRDFYPSIGGVMLKTQSLPACVRSRPRPVSTSDDPSELYAKVSGADNFIFRHNKFMSKNKISEEFL